MDWSEVINFAKGVSGWFGTP